MHFILLIIALFSGAKGLTRSEWNHGPYSSFVYVNETQHLREKADIRILLDHGGSYNHAEIFYSLALLGNRLFNTSQITYLIYSDYAEKLGLRKFWEKYWQEGPLKQFKYEWTHMNVPSIYFHRCMNPVTRFDQFDVRIVATMRNIQKAPIDSCLNKYQNSPRLYFIIHHAEAHLADRAIVWENMYIASNAREISKVSPRHFTPDAMPIQPKEPSCHLKPIVIIQGELTKRYLPELFYILDANPKFNITIRILTKSDANLLKSKARDKRIEFHKNLDMTSYHEKFLGGSFVLPLISSANTSFSYGYLKGHPTSSITYAKHFRIPIIGLNKIVEAYPNDINITNGYWHDGSIGGILSTFSAALQHRETWCQIHDVVRSSWFDYRQDGFR